MRVLLPCLALALLGCGDDSSGSQREVEPSPAEPMPDESPEAAPDEPACETDDDCVVVDVFGVDTSAEHRSRAEAVRREYERNALHRGEVSWAPPVDNFAYCVESVCELDRIEWPEFRHCEEEDTCEYIEDPCAAQLSVRASSRAAAERVVGAEERASSCEALAGALGDLSELFGSEEAPTPHCRRGFCR